MSLETILFTVTVDRTSNTTFGKVSGHQILSCLSTYNEEQREPGTSDKKME
jgi:hypothetical protein